MKNIIIGTAGHIDHGKTALIEALSGYNGDELKEEKLRGMTIDLSFTNIKRDDTNIAFIDVPGHEKLIKNMISGAFGFDATLFIVDVNEGIMPQTIEHLEVLNFLNITNIVFVLSKCDLSSKSNIKQKETQIRNIVAKYQNLNMLDILQTSIKDQKSIKKLKEYLFKLDIKKDETDEEFFRYYCDRVFSIKGFGEVVTGTVINGKIKVGEKVFVSELEKEILVKNIQIHSQDSKIATKHQRVALNLNIPHGKLQKGFLLTTKGYFRGFNAIDVFIKASLNKELKHDSTVQFLYGAKHLTAKIHLYNMQIDEGYLAKINFHQKVYLRHYDRFIVLQNGGVLGGGIVLDPLNDPIKKSKKIPLLQALYKQDYQSAFKLLAKNHKRGFGLVSSMQRFAKTHKEAIEIVKQIDGLFVDEKDLVVYPIEIKDEIKKSIFSIYDKNPHALLSPASINLRIKWASIALIKECLDEFVKEGFLEIGEGIYKRVDIGDINIDKELQIKVYDILQKEGFSPTAPYNLYDRLDIDRKLGDSILKKLTANKKVIRIAHNLFITSDNLSKIVALEKEIIRNEGYIDIKNFKDKLKLSRKYLIGYLEYLDRFDEIKKIENRRFMVTS